MKALVIADNEKIIRKIGSTLEKFGYDTIVYRWLLKALDNIEEISPHLIIISTEDYPRHWKTLTQFSNTESEMEDDGKPKVILYAGEHFSDEERSKAKALRVIGVFKDGDDEGEQTIGELEKILSGIAEERKGAPDAENSAPHRSFDEDFNSEASMEEIVDSGNSAEEKNVENVESEIVEKNSQEEISEQADVVSTGRATSDSPENPEISSTGSEPKTERKTMPCSFVFTNPVTLALVSGTARNFDGESLEFTPDISDFIKTIPEGTEIKFATLKVSEEIESIDSIKSVRASVVSNDFEKLVLKIS